MAPKKKGDAAPPPEESEDEKEEPVTELFDGHFLFPNGSTYSGQHTKVNDEVCMHGSGELYSGAGGCESFKGTFEKGFYKKGRFTSCAGAVYTGGFRDNRFHGIGEYHWADGRGYRGTWRDGSFHGRGRFINFTFAVDHPYVGFSIDGRFDSAPEEQSRLKHEFMSEYTAELKKSSYFALKELARKATPEQASRVYFVKSLEAAENGKIPPCPEEQYFTGPYLERTALKAPDIQEFVARLEAGGEGKPLLMVNILELKASESAAPWSGFIPADRLKLEQLRCSGQCIEFIDPEHASAQPGAVQHVVLVNVSADDEVSKAKWKVVHVAVVPEPSD